MVRTNFLERAGFLGEDGPARRKTLESMLESGGGGLVQARLHLGITLKQFSVVSIDVFSLCRRWLEAGGGSSQGELLKDPCTPMWDRLCWRELCAES